MVRSTSWLRVPTRLVKVRTGWTPSSHVAPSMSGSLAVVSIMITLPAPAW
jgi:hypothetical protein